ncbi:MAG: AtpZ/AtpI family protein [Patescibacteria group bacterium]|jgi:F0F1-type ATP synthase assembly protein I
MDETEAKKPKKPTSDAAYYRFAMRIVGDFGVSIAVPAVLAAFGGIWLDRQLGTTPWLLFAGLIAAFTSTYLVIKKKATDYAKKFDELGKGDKV